MEVIYIGDTIGIDARKQWYSIRKLGEVIPVDRDARGTGNRNQVNRVVGRTACCKQANDRVDDRFLIDNLANGDVVLAKVRVLQDASDGLVGEQRAQFGSGIHE